MSELDKGLLKIYLSKLPKGIYHRRDDNPTSLYRDGVLVATFDDSVGDLAQHEGLVAALVHVLNERDP